MQARIEVEDREVRKALAELRERMRHPRPALAAIGRKGRSLIQLGFRQGVDPYGERWLPLKRRKGGQPLRLTGRLMRSITEEATDAEVTWGTNAVYAAVHQFGHTFTRAARSQRAGWDARGRFAKGRAVKIGSWVTIGEHGQTVPARPFFPDAARGLPESWKDAFVSIVRRFLQGGQGEG